MERNTEFKYKLRDLKVGMIVRLSELSEIKNIKIVLCNISKNNGHTYGEITYIGKEVPTNINNDKFLIV